MVVSIKEQKEQKKGMIKRETKFQSYKDCLFENEIILKLKQRFKSEAHNLYTEEINKIALRSKDEKRLQTFDRITTYQYGTCAFKVCESETLSKYK